MRSIVRQRYGRKVMFQSWFPLHYEGRIYEEYCTYGKRFTWRYLLCILLGHTNISYSSVSVSSERGIETCVPARCCDRTYYPSPIKSRKETPNDDNTN